MKNAVRAAVLLSRQPLRPCASTPWVVQAIKAVRWAHRQGYEVLTSTGMQTWELVLSVASMVGVRQTVFVSPAAGDNSNRLERRLVHDFDLDLSLTRFRHLPMTAGRSPRDVRRIRDEAVVDAADVLIPVCLRPSGTMTRLVARADENSTTVMFDFATPYCRRTKRLKYAIDGTPVNPDLRRVADQYLIHWTRAANTCWPDERPIDYWRAVLSSTEYPRSAWFTLRNLLESNKIIASSRHMPAGLPTVSFSGLPPHEALSLMRWRARHTEMSFEPYGIGIDRREGARRAVKPVHYYDPQREERPAGPDRWRWQSRGMRTDWRQEEEYRHRGDFVLTGIPRDRLCVFTYRPVEAKQIQADYGLQAVAIGKGD